MWILSSFLLRDCYVFSLNNDSKDQDQISRKCLAFVNLVTIRLCAYLLLKKLVHLDMGFDLVNNISYLLFPKRKKNQKIEIN